MMMFFRQIEKYALSKIASILNDPSLSFLNKPSHVCVNEPYVVCAIEPSNVVKEQSKDIEFT